MLSLKKTTANLHLVNKMHNSENVQSCLNIPKHGQIPKTFIKNTKTEIQAYQSVLVLPRTNAFDKAWSFIK